MCRTPDELKLHLKSHDESTYHQCPICKKGRLFTLFISVCLSVCLSVRPSVRLKSHDESTYHQCPIYKKGRLFTLSVCPSVLSSVRLFVCLKSHDESTYHQCPICKKGRLFTLIIVVHMFVIFQLLSMIIWRKGRVYALSFLEGVWSYCWPILMACILRDQIFLWFPSFSQRPGHHYAINAGKSRHCVTQFS